MSRRAKIWEYEDEQTPNVIKQDGLGFLGIKVPQLVEFITAPLPFTETQTQRTGLIV